MSVKTLHIGKPIEALYDNFILHLPTDKRFLSNYKYVDNDGFKKGYAKYIKNRKNSRLKRLLMKIKK